MPDNPRREARREAGFPTQADLADKLGKHRSFVANVEAGIRPAPTWYDFLIEIVTENRKLEKKLVDRLD